MARRVANDTSSDIVATLGNPLFLIKARMQAYSPALPVGAQHNYRSSFHALSEVVKNEGKLGLIRGVGSAMLRTAMVSGFGSGRGEGADAFVAG